MTDAPSVHPGPVLVIGCGLVGTSAALALVGAGVEVHLRDAVPSNLELAVSRGAGTPDPVDAPGLVVVAVPPSAAPGVVRQALDDHPAAVVTDVASVKQPVVAAVTDHPGADRFVGGHPMAGRERSGPVAATAGLFTGRPWAVVPTDRTAPRAVAALHWLIHEVGAVPRTMTPADHDRAVATVSHVPHLAAVMVASLLLDAPADALDLAGPGLRDVTRIAGSETGLWLDILDGNAEQVRDLLGDLRDAVDRAVLALDDPAGLAAMLDAGRAGTRLIPGRHGGESESLAPVYVSVTDAPGELSRLWTDAGQSNVNIEDIRIDHELGRLVGEVEISVVESSADLLVATLAERGWPVHR